MHVIQFNTLLSLIISFYPIKLRVKCCVYLNNYDIRKYRSKMFQHALFTAYTSVHKYGINQCFISTANHIYKKNMTVKLT